MPHPPMFISPPYTNPSFLQHSVLPSTPAAPWCNSSYNNHSGKQTVQQFMSPPVASSPVVASMQTFYVKFIAGNISTCCGCI